MAKPTKRNRRPVEKADVLNFKEGVYLNEKSYGEVHLLDEQFDENNEVEYVFEGKLHKGAVALNTGKTLQITIPSIGYDHGYTLEGAAQEIFKAEKALSVYNPSERRTFVYINPQSKLTFVGDPEKTYKIVFHIYDNCHGENNNRWVVVFAEQR